ncbi:unannotated protein [freshwater metagenome]|uniref:Unannotated protein n=1 Tax=freshwater metagenome TaxID=449393 RepID=A0A6J7JDV2_9ZZZZ
MPTASAGDPSSPAGAPGPGATPVSGRRTGMDQAASGDGGRSRVTWTSPSQPSVGLVKAIPSVTAWNAADTDQVVPSKVAYRAVSVPTGPMTRVPSPGPAYAWPVASSRRSKPSGPSQAPPSQNVRVPWSATFIVTLRSSPPWRKVPSSQTPSVVAVAACPPGRGRTAVMPSAGVAAAANRGAPSGRSRQRAAAPSPSRRKSTKPRPAATSARASSHAPPPSTVPSATAVSPSCASRRVSASSQPAGAVVPSSATQIGSRVHAVPSQRATAVCSGRPSIAAKPSVRPSSCARAAIAVPDSASAGSGPSAGRTTVASGAGATRVGPVASRVRTTRCSSSGREVSVPVRNRPPRAVTRPSPTVPA